MFKVVLLFLSVVAIVIPRSLRAEDVRSGETRLAIASRADRHPGLSLGVTGDSITIFSVTQREPATILVKHGNSLHKYTAMYDTVERQRDGLLATASVTTAAGSKFQVVDRYHAVDSCGDFRLDRMVLVVNAVAADEGFNSQFSLGFQRPAAILGLEFFSPAVWYKQNAYAAKKDNTRDNPDTFFYYRELRTALPLIAVRDPRSGRAITLYHLDPQPLKWAGSPDDAWQVDDSIHYASLGVERPTSPQIGIIYPVIEKRKVQGAPGEDVLNRSHPVQAGFSHSYSVLIKFERTASYEATLVNSWRYFYEVANPIVTAVPLEKIYRSQIELLSHYATAHNGIMGWPFAVKVPDGTIAVGRHGISPSISYQMGYVGQQLPNAYQLIRYGLRNKDDFVLTQGVSIVDFWAGRSSLPSGLPQVWYNVTPPTFRNTALLYMRQLSDGMEGALAAAQIMRANHQTKVGWENFCSRFGDWLFRHQNSDGSFYRAYNADSTAAQRSKLNTAHPIRFLVRLYFATGNKKYLQTALRAGNYSLREIVRPSLYAGGTVDEPEPVQDKEAGAEAMHAFLALYDATHESRWIRAAILAAEYTETWELSWQYPIVTSEPAFLRAGTRGESFIKSGTPGVDIFLSFEACTYYRLSLYTGDTHFRDFAQLILANTKLTTDWDGSLGYAEPGLVREAANLANGQVNPRIGWLPWLADAELSSMTELEDIFGSSSIDKIQQLPLLARQRLNRNAPGHPGALGWSRE